MSSSITAVFPAYSVRARIDLLEDAAPNTVAWIRRLLVEPIEAEAWHAMYAGPEVEARMEGMPLPLKMPTHAPENQTVTPAAGDVMFTCAPANTMVGQSVPLARIGFFYAFGASTFGPLGWVPVGIFGRVHAEDLPAFAEACRDVRRTGVKPIILSL